MGCVNKNEAVTRSAKAQAKFLDELLGNNIGTNIIEIYNRGYGLEFNPDGSQSVAYADLLNNYKEDMALFRRAIMYTKKFTDVHGVWFKKFKDEPSAPMGNNYKHNIDPIYKASDLLINNKPENVGIYYSNTVIRDDYTNDNFKTYGEFNSAINYINTFVISYVNEIMKKRLALTKQEDRPIGEIEFYRKGLSLHINDIKASILNETKSLINILSEANSTSGASLAAIYSDIVNNVNEDNIWNTALKNIQSDVIVKPKEDTTIDEDSGVSDTFARDLFNKVDYTKSTKGDINNNVKNRILTIRDKSFDSNGNIITIFDENTGLPKSADFNKIQYTLRSKTADIKTYDSNGDVSYADVVKMTTVDEMFTIINKLAIIHPTINELNNMLLEAKEVGDTDFINGLFKSLNTMRTQGVVTLINKDSDGTMVASTKYINKRDIFAAADSIASGIRFKMTNAYLNNSKLNELKSSLLSIKSYEEGLSTISNVAHELEIPITPYDLQLMYKLNVGVNKFTKDIISLINDLIATNNARTKDTIDVLNVIVDKKPMIHRILGRLNAIGEYIVDIKMNTYEDSLINSDGEREFNNRYSNNIKDTISFIKSPLIPFNEHKAFIDRLALTNDFQYSNWARSLKILKATPKNKRTDVMYKTVLAELRNITYEDYAGSKNFALNTKGKYKKLSETEWLKSMAITFINKNKITDKNTTNLVRTPSIIFSDSSQFGLFKHIKIDINNDKERLLSLRSALVSQEIARMINARDMLFDYNKDNKVNPYSIKKDFKGKGKNKLHKFYHINGSEIISSKNDKKKGLVKGEVTGNIFKFQNIPSLNAILRREGYINAQGLPTNGLNNILGYLQSTEKDAGNAVDSKEVRRILDIIDTEIANTVNNERTKLANKYRFMKSSIESLIDVNDDYKNAVKKSRRESFDYFIHDLAINTMISNIEQMTFFHGVTAAHKNYIDVNKRAKKGASPGTPGGTYGLSNDLKIAIINDISIKSTYIEQLSNIITKNELNNLKESYSAIDIADGQGYITVDGYVKVLKSWGDYDKINNYFEKINGRYFLRESLSNNDLISLLRPIKPFYAANIYDENTNIITPIQIKNSLTLLIPEFIKGTKLEDINNAMISKNIEQLVLESAVKNGIHKVNQLTKSDSDELNLDVLSNMDTITLDRRSFRNQVDVVDHHEDTRIKAGIQIFKLILANIPDNLSFDFNGLKTGKEIKKHFFDVMNDAIIKNSNNIIERTSTLFDENDNINYENLKDLLVELLGDRIDYNTEQSLALNKDKTNFKVSLDLMNKSKIESLLNSLFTKNITDLKVPGIHSVYFSNAYMTPSPISDKGLSNKYILSNDKRNPNSRKLDVYIDDDGKQVFEAIMPAWSKHFFNEDGSLIDINLLSEEVRTMLSYRIPTSARHAAFTIKVVGFAPKTMGSIIILPHDVIARTGADFDIDTFYINRKAFTYNTENGIFEDIKYNNITKDNIPDNILKLDAKSKNKSYYYTIFNDYLDRSGFYDEVQSINSKYEISLLKVYNNGKNINTVKELKDIKQNVLNTAKSTVSDIVKTNNKLRELNDKYTTYYKSIKRSKYALDNKITNLNKKLKEKPNNVKLKEKLSKLEYKLNTYEKELSKYKEAQDEIIKTRNVFYTKLQNTDTDITKLNKETSEEYKKRDATIKQLTTKRNNKLKELFDNARDSFIAIPKNEQHSTDVMFNEVLDVMNNIMSNKHLMYQNVETANFREARKVAEDIEKLKTSSNYNPIFLSSQIELRTRGLIAQEVLGIFANNNAVGAIFQEVQAKMDGVTIPVTYNVDYYIKEYNRRNNTNFSRTELMSKLTNKYKSNLKYKYGEKTFTIFYDSLGTSPDGSTTTLFDKEILNEFGQMVDYAPDAIKEPLPPNTNPFTSSVITAYGLVGDLYYGLASVAQYGISELIRNQNELNENKALKQITQKDLSTRVKNMIELNTAIMNNVNNGISIENIAKSLENQTVKTSVSKAFNKLYRFTNVEDAIRIINNHSGTINVKISKYEQGTGKYNIKDMNNILENTKNYTYNDIMNNIKLAEDYKSNNLNINDSIKFLHNEIVNINKFYKMKAIGDSIGKYVRLLNADKNGLGKTISNNAEYIKSIVNFNLTSVNDINIISKRIEPINVDNIVNVNKVLKVNDKSKNAILNGNKTIHIQDKELKPMKVNDIQNVQIGAKLYAIRYKGYLDKNTANEISRQNGIDDVEDANLAKYYKDVNSPVKEKGTSIKDTINTTNKGHVYDIYEIENNDNIIKGIYTSIFGDNKSNSLYPILDTYVKHSNIVGLNITSKLLHWHTGNPEYANIYNSIVYDMGYITERDKERVIRTINKNLAYSFITNVNNTDNGAILEGVENSNTILGVNKEAPTTAYTYDTITLNDFINLSLGEQIKLYKEINKININANHIVNYINPRLDPISISKYKHHNIEVVNIVGEDNLLIELGQSHRDMLYNTEDPKANIIARNMINYNILKFALQFGNGSFTHMLHKDILDSPGFKVNNIKEDSISLTNSGDVINNTIYQLVSSQKPSIVRTEDDGQGNEIIVTKDSLLLNSKNGFITNITMSELWNNYRTDGLLLHNINLLTNKERTKEVFIQLLRQPDGTVDIIKLGIKPHNVGLTLENIVDRNSELSDIETKETIEKGIVNEYDKISKLISKTDNIVKRC